MKAMNQSSVDFEKRATFLEIRKRLFIKDDKMLLSCSMKMTSNDGLLTEILLKIISLCTWDTF